MLVVTSLPRRDPGFCVKIDRQGDGLLVVQRPITAVSIVTLGIDVISAIHEIYQARRLPSKIQLGPVACFTAFEFQTFFTRARDSIPDPI